MHTSSYFFVFLTIPLCVQSKNFYKTLSLCSSEFNNSFLDSLGSDEDSGNEDILDMEYTEAEAEELKRNAEVGDVLFPKQNWSDGQDYSSCSFIIRGPTLHVLSALWLPANGFTLSCPLLLISYTQDSK